MWWQIRWLNAFCLAATSPKSLLPCLFGVSVDDAEECYFFYVEQFDPILGSFYQFFQQLFHLIFNAHGKKNNFYPPIKTLTRVVFCFFTLMPRTTKGTQKNEQLS